MTDERPRLDTITPPNRRAERRADEDARAARARADRDAEAERRENAKDAEAERKRKDAEAKAARRRAEQDTRAKAKAKKRKERRERFAAFRTALSSHMPTWGLPVVAVSMAVGWAGQAAAASHLGMGWASAGVPILTEGMTLTFAGLTAQAIENRRPYKWLLTATWVTATVAASVNGLGHLIEDSSAAGIYRAVAYAAASLAALVLWAVVMRSKRAAVSGRTAEELARWRRLRRRHPFLYRRAVRAADNTGQTLAAAWSVVWERTQGAAPGEPSIREIRAARRAAYRRAVAESWDGRRWREKPLGELAPAHDPTPAVAESIPDPDAGTPAAAVSADESETVPAPTLPVALLVPGTSGEWVKHPVPVLPVTGSRTAPGSVREGATTRFPQGKDAVPDPVRETVHEDRLAGVREMVDEAAERGDNLARKPSNRAVAKRIGCRPGTARELLAEVLAERGVTR